METDEQKADVSPALYGPLCTEEPVEMWPMLLNAKEKREIQLETIRTASQNVLVGWDI